MDEIKPGQRLSPEQAMRLAIHEGARGTGHVAPNPLVGCVIVDNEHRLLATGYHAKVGHDHAEAAALRKLDASSVAGSHVYVTLEPCAHQGRTPSCARALAPLKPQTVTYAVEDPNPLVAGRGAAILREAGVTVYRIDERTDMSPELCDELIAASEDLAEIFLHNHRAHEPFVGVKVASTLDGQMAFKSGESKWITGEAARRHAHAVRARYDAVAVGSGTFFSDDPSLDIRHPDFSNVVNRAVVFDPDGRALAALAGKNLVKVRKHENVIVIVGRGSQFENPAKATVIEAGMHAGEFDLDEALAGLKNAGVTSLMIEGGATTIGAFFRAGKVQRLHLYQAPTVFGARQALAWSSGFGVATLSERYRFSHTSWQSIGSDLYWTGRTSSGGTV